MHGPQLFACHFGPQGLRQRPEQASRVGDGPQAGAISWLGAVDGIIRHEKLRMWNVVLRGAPHDERATKQTHADHAERPGINGMCGLGGTQDNLRSPYVLGSADVARRRHTPIDTRDGTT